MKIVTIVGARPQFVKAATVSRALAEYANINEIIVDTGQHYDNLMNSIFFEELDIPMPQHTLGVGSGKHGEQTGRMLALIEEVYLEEQPDLTIVYGDTNSTLAGALAAAKLHIPVAHVEAGLRSFNRRMPEEINRIMTDHISDILFAPTELAIENLRREGVNDDKIFYTGDVMYDATLSFGNKTTEIVSKLNLTNKNYILTTIHRADNTDDEVTLRSIVKILNKVSEDYQVVFPIHPRTKKMFERFNMINDFLPSVMLIEPLGYLDIMTLQKNCKLVVTDSGGLQKEAYFNGIPCVTLRRETEWMELVDAGWNVLADPNNVNETVGKIKNAKGGDQRAILYGGGTASRQIANIINMYSK